jgi:hypothetical protein
MKQILSLVFFAFLFIQLKAQDFDSGKLSGSIIDQKSKEPIIGAVIQVLETGKGITSDENGNFIFDKLPVGTYTLKISYVGYLSIILPNQSVLKNKTINSIIELEQDIKSLNEVNIKVFRFENTKSKPISTFSFSRDEISLNPGAQGDIFRAIGMLPGVTSSGGIYSAIAVRGQGVRDNVYMVDDVPLTEVGHLEGNSFFNDPNGGRFSIFAPRVIDNAVFQGAAFGAEYGRRSASYLGLNIKEGNTTSPVFDGQVDLLGVNLNYDGPSYFNKKSSLFVSARYQNFYPLVHVVGLKSLGLPSYGDLIIKSTTEINKKNKLNFLLMVCPERFVRDIDNVYEDKELNLLYLPDFKRNKIVSSVNLRTLIGKQSIWKNIVYFSSYSSDVNVGKAYPVANSNGELISKIFNYNNSIQTQNYRESKTGFRSFVETSILKNDRFLFGIEADIVLLSNDRNLLVNDTNFIFRRQELPNPLLNYQVITPALVNSNGVKSATNGSSFITYFVEATNRISLQTGLRLDYNGFTEQVVLAPRATITYHLNSNHSLSFGTGIYYQDPVLSDIADLPNSTKLKMEKVVQFIVSYKGYLYHDVKLMVEAWSKKFDNMVVTPISGSVFRNNNGTGFGNGFDISLNKRLNKKWHGIVSYSYMNMTRNNNDGLGNYPFTFSQPHQLNTMLSYSLNSKFSFSGKYRIASGRPTDAFIIHTDVLNNPNNYRYSMELVGRNTERLPLFSSLDLRVNYMFKINRIKFTSFFDVVNVLNRQIANNENFNYLFGKTFYDGIAIFPTGGLKFEF